ncbi:hypothetical protein K491DRAFT_551596, partial [Lophiostoma macrostomum CBS 122681]
YNSTYSLPPSLQTDNAWAGLFPNTSGFIQNPRIPNETLAIAAFHQLHCLNGLRLAYYNSSYGNNPHVHDHQPSHVRHCIDYLRQSIMCAADANVEPVQQSLGGVTGWNTERNCRDYRGLVTWAN